MCIDRICLLSLIGLFSVGEYSASVYVYPTRSVFMNVCWFVALAFGKENKHKQLPVIQPSICGIMKKCELTEHAIM